MKKFLGAAVLAAFFFAPFAANAQTTDRMPTVGDMPSVSVIHADGSVLKPPDIVSIERRPSGCITEACVQHFSAHNMRTDAGASAAATNLSGTGGSPFIYIALSSDAASPLKGDTTCPGEFTTGGMARGAATFNGPGTGGYTAPTTGGGVASYTETISFSVTASSYTLRKLCLLNAASGGTLMFETLLGAPISGGTGDALNVTWTIQE